MKLKLVLLCLVLTGLSIATAQTRIEVWYSLGQNFGAPLFEEFSERFNAERDDIVADAIYAGVYADTVQKAQAAVAAGNPPAVLMLEQTRGPAFVDAQAVLSLEQLISSDPDFDLSDFPEPLLETCRIDGTLYCIPFNPSTPIVFHNKDMFREVGLDPETDVPETWDELLAIGDDFARYNDNGELERRAFGLPTAPTWLFDTWLGQAGGTHLNEQGDAFVFNDEHGVRVAEFWLELIENDVARPFQGAQNNASPDFFGGRQAMMVASTASLESRFEQAEFDIGAAPFWCGEQCYVPIGGANLFITEKSSEAERQAAWEFIKWITSTENTAEFAAATGYMAVRRSALETETMREQFQRRPEARITYEQMESHGHPRPLVPFWNDVQSQITVASEKVLLDNQDPQRALDEAVAEADRLLRVYAR
ncbi:MAG: ABC transporter substrate-binding protein [Trueperaceae bacterium]